MKKTKSFIRKRFYGVRFYLDDYYKIIDVLKKNCKDVKIKTDEYELEDPTEIEKLDLPVIRELSIRTTDPDINIDLSKNGAYIGLFADEDDVSGIGVLTTVQKILFESRRLFLDKKIISLIAAFIVGILGGYYISDYPYIIFFLIAIIIPLPYSPYPVPFLLYPQKRMRSSFWNRRKDEIIIAIITAIVTIILTLIGEAVVKRYL